MVSDVFRWWRAHEPGATSSDTVYYDRAGRVLSYYVYHSRRISRAAAIGHARDIQRLCSDVRSRATRLRAADAAAAIAFPTPVVPTHLSPAAAAAAVAAGLPTAAATLSTAVPATVVSPLSSRVL